LFFDVATPGVIYTAAHLFLEYVRHFELWEFSRIDHYGSHKPVSVLPPSSAGIKVVRGL